MHARSVLATIAALVIISNANGQAELGDIEDTTHTMRTPSLRVAQQRILEWRVSCRMAEHSYREPTLPLRDPPGGRIADQRADGLRITSPTDPVPLVIDFRTRDVSTVDLGTAHSRATNHQGQNLRAVDIRETSTRAPTSRTGRQRAAVLRDAYPPIPRLPTRRHNP